ncbi:MAG: hypothetical protein GY820_19645, partial [Gammaproteobacteria bacterium]|nr:hypothetical protein [Gammaproteobacteria bacterium]
EEQPSYYPCEENYYVGEASQPSQSDQNMATGFQQIQERLSLNQTNLVEQITNQGAASQQVLDEQSQRLTKVEETLKAHISNISASCSAKPAKEEVYDDSPSSSGTTSLNIYTVAPNLLTEAYVPWVPGSGPMPLQCVDVPKLKVNVEGKIFKCIVDTGAGPSLVVPENLGREILGRKYGTQAEVDKAIYPTDPQTSVSDCQGG